MLYIWWNIQGINHYELCNKGVKTEKSVYFEQVYHLRGVLVDKTLNLINKNELYKNFLAGKCSSDYHDFRYLRHSLEAKQYMNLEVLRIKTHKFKKKKFPKS